jgi:hypothetical protein
MMTSKTNAGLWLMPFLPLVLLGVSQSQSDTIPSLLLALFILLPSAKLAGFSWRKRRKWVNVTPELVLKEK